MSLIDNFIYEYQAKYTKELPKFDDSLLGSLKKAKFLLLDEKLAPSPSLKEALDKLQIRAEEPMKVAITGQFSSGKSTFLNALLSRSILPTGITPVTSKVNYIKYGDDFKICVRYKDGRDEYHDVEDIASYTDQRERVEDIAYLTLYAPLNILKDVVFVDTPGLNSQADSDTETTQRVLKEVDGIIWLTLIDNAGKMSELEVLQEYLGEYKNKSLCVLNQKDKFSEEQIEQTTSYVKTAFVEFFSDVIAISARQALESRSHDKTILLGEQRDSLLEKIKNELESNESLDLDAITQQLANYQNSVSEILQSNLEANIALLEASNINKVLDFIKNEIQPKSVEAKEFAISKELNNISEALLLQQNQLIGIYDELANEITEFELRAKDKFVELKQKFSTDLKSAFKRIEQIIETIADAIYKEITTHKLTRYEEQKAGLLGNKVQYVPFEYSAPKINSDIIYKKLFYDDNIIGSMFKQYVKNLTLIQDEVNKNNLNVYKDVEERVLAWQSKYEVIRKSIIWQSELEYANMRKFASKAYEAILKPFNDEIAASYAKISSEFSHLASAVNFNYQNATEVCVAFLENKIEKSVKLYEANPTKFSLYQPKLDEIKERLKTSFYLYELENMMNSNYTFLSRDYDRLLDKFDLIKNETVQFLDEHKKRHEKALEVIQSIKNE